MIEEVKINKQANSITFTNNNISFSQFGIAKEILELIENQQSEIERLKEDKKKVREYIKENQEEHKYTDRGGFTYTEGHFLRNSDTLLEILDKEKK